MKSTSFARAGEGPRGLGKQESPDVAALMRTPVDKAGEEDSLQYDRSPCFLNAVAVDLPWGGFLLGAVFEGIIRNSEMLVGVLIGRGASQSASDEDWVLV